MLDVLKTLRGRLRKLCIFICSLFTLGRPGGWILLLLAFRIFFLIFLPSPRLPLYTSCVLWVVPLCAFYNIL
jgi:hypothetical protein